VANTVGRNPGEQTVSDHLWVPHHLGVHGRQGHVCLLLAQISEGLICNAVPLVRIDGPLQLVGKALDRVVFNNDQAGAGTTSSKLRNRSQRT